MLKKSFFEIPATKRFGHKTSKISQFSVVKEPHSNDIVFHSVFIVYVGKIY